MARNFILLMTNVVFVRASGRHENSPPIYRWGAMQVKPRSP